MLFFSIGFGKLLLTSPNTMEKDTPLKTSESRSYQHTRLKHRSHNQIFLCQARGQVASLRIWVCFPRAFSLLSRILLLFLLSSLPSLIHSGAITQHSEGRRRSRGRRRAGCLCLFPALHERISLLN